ncbi:hypothetical protein MMC25_005578 [Agyrium rufum]|nr:hypothetical protein [Agyrium rufum]
MSSLKRSQSDAFNETGNFFDQPPKQLHTLHHKSSNWTTISTLFYQDDDAAQRLLTRSIGLALEAVGFQSAEAAAVESLRVLTDACWFTLTCMRSRILMRIDMARFLGFIRQSMLACRRSQSTPQDFLQALRAVRLTLSSLERHLDPPVTPSKSIICPEPTPSLLHDEMSTQLPNLSALLEQNPQTTSKPRLPKGFPSLPSGHTYKATPHISNHESDPRQIRERATEEGRLGEAALRKFVIAGATGKREEAEQAQKAHRKSREERKQQLWREVMIAATKEGVADNLINYGTGRNISEDKDDAVGVFTADSAVNSDRVYWRRGVRSRV